VEHSNVNAAEPAANTATFAADGMSSTKDHGLIKVVVDPTLADGRLVFKVVAFNRDRIPAGFGPDSIKVFTAAGQPIPLMSLEQLVNEARGSPSSRAVDVFGSSAPLVGRDQAGRPDVSNYTGGGNSMGSTISTREQSPGAAGKEDPKVRQQVADLQAAILKPLMIGPASAAGGQVVTQKIRFGRKEEHALRLLVEFNSEQHEFNFTAPRVR
jgi:hypothetical protein